MAVAEVTRLPFSSLATDTGEFRYQLTAGVRSFHEFFYEHMMRPPPIRLRLLRAENLLELTWTASAPPQSLSAFELRCACRCAGCVDEFTGAALLDPATVPAEVAIADVRSVGNYAVQLGFSDRHSTGIYTWDHLFALGVE